MFFRKKEPVKEQSKQNIDNYSAPITPKEALAISNDTQAKREQEKYQHVDEDLKAIYRRIRGNAENGYRYADMPISCYDEMHESVFEKIKNDGFTVSTETATCRSGGEQWEEKYIKISW